MNAGVGNEDLSRFSRGKHGACLSQGGLAPQNMIKDIVMKATTKKVLKSAVFGFIALMIWLPKVAISDEVGCSIIQGVRHSWACVKDKKVVPVYRLVPYQDSQNKSVNSQAKEYQHWQGTSWSDQYHQQNYQKQFLNNESDSLKNSESTMPIKYQQNRKSSSIFEQTLQDQSKRESRGKENLKSSGSFEDTLSNVDTNAYRGHEESDEIHVFEAGGWTGNINMRDERIVYRGAEAHYRPIKTKGSNGNVTYHGGNVGINHVRGHGNSWDFDTTTTTVGYSQKTVSQKKGWDASLNARVGHSDIKTGFRKKESVFIPSVAVGNWSRRKDGKAFLPITNANVMGYFPFNERYSETETNGGTDNQAVYTSIRQGIYDIPINENVALTPALDLGLGYQKGQNRFTGKVGPNISTSYKGDQVFSVGAAFVSDGYQPLDLYVNFHTLHKLGRDAITHRVENEDDIQYGDSQVQVEKENAIISLHDEDW